MQVELNELRQKVVELAERVDELEKARAAKRDTLSLRKDAPRD